MNDFLTSPRQGQQNKTKQKKTTTQTLVVSLDLFALTST